MSRQEGEECLEGGLQPWDWRYYAEKARIEKYDFDEILLKPYFSSEKVTEALFSVSGKLFGLTFLTNDRTFNPIIPMSRRAKSGKELHYEPFFT